MKPNIFKLNHYYRNIPTYVCEQYYLKLISITTVEQGKIYTYICVNPSEASPSIEYGLNDWLWQCDVDYEEIDANTFKDAVIKAKKGIEKILKFKF